MSKALITHFSFPARADAICLSFPANLPLDAWLTCGKMLKKMGEGVQWWIGDWLLYGENTYEEFSQLADEIGLTPNHLQNMLWVSTAVKVSTRKPELSWSHHREVAPMKTNQQVRWLNRAIKEDWTSKDLRKTIREESNPNHKPRQGKEISCPECGYSWRPE